MRPGGLGFASGRAEDSILFHKNLHFVQIFVKKIKQYHAAAGDSAVYLVTCPVCMPTAYVVYMTIVQKIQGSAHRVGLRVTMAGMLYACGSCDLLLLYRSVQSASIHRFVILTRYSNPALPDAKYGLLPGGPGTAIHRGEPETRRRSRSMRIYDIDHTDGI